MTREGEQQPGDETRSWGCGAKVEKMEKVEKVEKLELNKFISCCGQVSWNCYLVAFHWETQGTFSTLLVPFRNVISERRTLQNKSVKFIVN
jgi:hypothetical protein